MNDSTKRMNVVPFKACDAFDKAGIDWTREPCSDAERTLREAYLTYESSAGTSGLISLLLLGIVSRRQGTIAPDLQYVADRAEIVLSMKLRQRQCDVLNMLAEYVSENGPLWQ
ncbi:MAG: hypothetical protein JO036_15140 [Candidatus Eremiobacteraeota bacterium]|nr:hypothetical protein [Candidatus Eremiobacteraeota bacterium]